MAEYVTGSLGVAQALQRYQDVQRALEGPMQPGDTWYVVSSSWYLKWVSACAGEVHKETGGTIDQHTLGPVDNSGLADGAGNMDDKVTEGLAIELVPQKVWDMFCTWYGQPSPSHVLPRRVVPRGITEQLYIELHPVCLRVFVVQKESRHSPLRLARSPKFIISDADTMSAVRAAAVAALRPFVTIPDESFSAWTVPKHLLKGMVSLEVSLSWLRDAEARILKDSDATVEEMMIVPKDGIVVSLDGSVDLDAVASSTSVANVPSPEKRPLGTVALYNLGHTCYMNSALQCLSHTKELTEYFTSGAYKSELNPDNPLGWGGAIAEAYGSLLSHLWDATATAPAYSPRPFKSAVARFAPHFNGYVPHDSQELLAFLLDGLHEDLNRVRRKPYVENPEWQGGGAREKADLAQRAWEGYKQRNDSVVVDLFQGQYQSSLVCPVCKTSSITFDPFMYLTLPIPTDMTWRHTILYIPKDLDKSPVKVPVDMVREASFKSLQDLMGRWMGASAENLLVLEVYKSRFSRVLDENVQCGELKENVSVACFELPCPATPSQESADTSPFVMPLLLCDGSSSTTGISDLFGYPLVVTIAAEEARSIDGVYSAVARHLQRWTQSKDGKTDVAADNFQLQLQSNHKEFGTRTFGFNSFARHLESWDHRRTEGGILLRRNDGLVCLFGSNTKTSALVDKSRHASWWKALPELLHPEYIAARKSAEERESRGLTLSDCLAEFTKEERLGADNPWYCAKCNEYQQATKKLDVWKAPDILVVHLKRFSNNRAQRGKIEAFVDFPVTGLDLGDVVGQRSTAKELLAQGTSIDNLGLPPINKPLLYDLFAVSENEGHLLSNGHYRAYVLNHGTEKWYRFTDAEVIDARAEQAVSKHAYLLFYRRRRDV